ncbi:hypothetical protein BJY01DRAFT_212295 [Aspergillus pseudoustus]|uniref:Uncharacterized protein n=1 Tax=Aspergillus pseudoustus TaxID=1810923 RepID=A0ABR4KA41_9EURO
MGAKQIEPPSPEVQFLESKYLVLVAFSLWILVINFKVCYILGYGLSPVLLFQE